MNMCVCTKRKERKKKKTSQYYHINMNGSIWCSSACSGPLLSLLFWLREHGKIILFSRLWYCQIDMVRGDRLKCLCRWHFSLLFDPVIEHQWHSRSAFFQAIRIRFSIFSNSRLIFIVEYAKMIRIRFGFQKGISQVKMCNGHSK